MKRQDEERSKHGNGCPNAPALRKSYTLASIATSIFPRELDSWAAPKLSNTETALGVCKPNSGIAREKKSNTLNGLHMYHNRRVQKISDETEGMEVRERV